MTNQTNGAELEIEVAYLPHALPDELLVGTPTQIVDIYLSPEDDLLTKLRLRQKGDAYELTKKVNIDPSDLSLQDEYTIPLSREEFEKLRSAGGREVTKDRYTMPLNGHTVEIDVFKNQLDGLALIEVEFPSVADKDSFEAPTYFGQEVTQENFIAGAYLAGKSFDDLKPDIARVYEKSL
jgi:CYTH domain-containing protein